LVLLKVIIIFINEEIGGKPLEETRKRSMVRV
jgi:hypothetical protein